MNQPISQEPTSINSETTKASTDINHALAGKRHKRVVPLSYQAAGLLFNLAGYCHQRWAGAQLANLWFRVFKRKPSPKAQQFWQSAEQVHSINVNQHKVDLHLWGSGPLVVCLHGWSGSGIQFRHFVKPLVEAGYQVAAFDAPGHGMHTDKHSHLLNFSDSLSAIAQQYAPVHCVLAHSFGAMATTTAQQRGFTTNNIVMLAPHLNVQEMFNTYAKLLNLSRGLKTSFQQQVGEKMQHLLAGDDPWQLFTVERLVPQTTKGLLISDDQDQEVAQHQFKQIEQRWTAANHYQTQGLGHFKILKDPQVIEQTVQFLVNQRKIEGEV
ncbi:hypothetical protein AHAT_26040 [Agarivorans sp. Toyoura001]|uniref:alpha/beta fold hydrolase n=1 Tax=Agarivorans sp. Toyoura001 TaxID=2283141 RepID=UPI0010EC292E|nr:alpha/beta fold hydrolase [Agarivorans sp. Toyoura001]GDY26714.1 hypothetical protein AHAT_26040 [Agarivorans sp. Toyoura001]